MSYKDKLLQARKMMGRSGLALYDRMRILMEVFDDRIFRTEENIADDLKADEYLTAGYLRDVSSWSFLELRSLMQFAPDKSQWGTGDLRRLMAECIEANRPKREERATRTRVTAEELEAARSQAKHAEARAKYVETELLETKKSYEQLCVENRELREELAHAKGRIAELERMLTRQLQPA